MSRKKERCDKGCIRRWRIMTAADNEKKGQCYAHT